MRWLLIASLSLWGCGASDKESGGDSGGTTTGATGGGGAGGGGGGGGTGGGGTTTPAPQGGLAVAFAPIDLPSSGSTEINITLHDVGDGFPLTADLSEYEIAPGVFISASTTVLEPPAFVDPATWIGGVDASASPVPVDLAGEVLGVWYLMPFDHVSPDGLSMRITNTFGLTDGDDIEMWVGEYADSLWHEVDVAVAGEDLAVTGLPVLSTLVLVKDAGGANPPDFTEVEVSGAATLSGVVTDSSGTPVEGARIQFCRGTECKTATAAADGSYIFEELDGGTGSFEVIPPYEG
jgi:hypothetical protein